MFLRKKYALVKKNGRQHLLPKKRRTNTLPLWTHSGVGTGLAIGVCVFSLQEWMPFHLYVFKTSTRSLRSYWCSKNRIYAQRVYLRLSFAHLQKSVLSVFGHTAAAAAHCKTRRKTWDINKFVWFIFKSGFVDWKIYMRHYSKYNGTYVLVGNHAHCYW